MQGKNFDPRPNPISSNRRDKLEREREKFTHQRGWRPIDLRQASLGSRDKGVAGGWGSGDGDGNGADFFARSAEEREFGLN